MYILCRNCEKNFATASELIFYVSANVWLLLGVSQCFLSYGQLLVKDINMRLLLKENVQLILFYVEDCMAASENISMFFKERATVSEKILRKNVRLLLKKIFKKNVQLLLRIMST